MRIKELLTQALNKTHIITVDDIFNIMDNIEKKEIRQLKYIFSSIEFNELFETLDFNKSNYISLIEKIQEETELKKDSISRSLAIIFTALIKGCVNKEIDREFNFGSGIKLVSSKGKNKELIDSFSKNEGELLNEVEGFLLNLYSFESNSIFDIDKNEYKDTLATVICGYLRSEKEQIKTEYNKVISDIEEMAKNNIDVMQWALGIAYVEAMGKNVNYEKAIELFRKASEQGYARAQCSLGYMYAKGEGIKQDKEKAVEWYKKAAEQGNASAQFHLGYMYDIGEGIKQDKEKAKEWYRKAAYKGHKLAMECLRQL